MRRSHPPHASITVAVLVCLVVITLIGAGLLRLVGSQQATIRGEERTLQADWLAESGIEHAAARLSDDPDYHGETWSLSANDLGGPAPGVVLIAVEPRRDGSNQCLVTVRADYPSDSDRRVRSSKQAIVDLGPARSGATP